MSHLELQPGFDFQQAGKEVLAIEREGLAELDQYINQILPSHARKYSVARAKSW
jgi:hypothetical protein